MTREEAYAYLVGAAEEVVAERDREIEEIEEEPGIIAGEDSVGVAWLRDALKILRDQDRFGVEKSS